MTRRFPIRFSPVTAVFLGVLGLGRRWSYAEVSDDAVSVRMGYAFRSTVARATITGAKVLDRISWGWGIGVHGWGGRWAVNGTLRSIVHLEISPPARGRVLGVPVKVRELWVSLEDPDGFRSAIGR